MANADRGIRTSTSYPSVSDEADSVCLPCSDTLGIQDWLYLLNQAGERQAQMHAPGKLVAAACADDGSAYVAVGAQGEIWWLAPDLHSRWEHSMPHPVTALALDPFGQYLAVADAGSNLSLFDCQGRPGVHFQSPRSLYHLAFVPTAPYILAGSDYGLAA